MLNPLTAYEECGYRCAMARRNSDEGLAKFEKDWFNRARRLEKPEDRPAAQEAFDRGYAAAQPARKPEYAR